MMPVALEPLQVVQAAVQVYDIGLLPEDPLVEAGEHVRAVAAVLRRADDDGLTLEPGGDPRRIAESDRIADEHDPREPGRGGCVCLAPARFGRREQADDREK